jgi:hypothetical protein
MEIDRLLLIAGPSCSGKSTFIADLGAGRLPRVARQLDLGAGIGDGTGELGGWQVLLARDLPRLADARLERVILHYDFLQSWSPRRIPIYAEEGSLRILRAAAEITLVTLWAPAGVLEGRIAARRKTFVGSLLSGKPWNSETLQNQSRSLDDGAPPERSLPRALLAIHRELRRLGAKRRLYRRPRALRHLYEEWISFCSQSVSARNWILDTTWDTTRGPAELLPWSSWTHLSRFP